MTFYKMTVAFFSNFINHHEIPFCDELYNLTGGKFCFVQTQPMDMERVNLGWGKDLSIIPYLKYSYENEQDFRECLKIGLESDVVILGSAPYEFIAKRVNENKLTFYYAERLFRKGIIRAFYPPSTLKILKRFVIPGRKSNFHLLCASAYTAFDIKRIFTFKHKMYRWAHFPKYIEHNIDNLISSKPVDVINILWAGRFINLKHPEYAIKLAGLLKKNGIRFSLNMIGIGEMENELKLMVKQGNLYDVVTFHGMMPPAEVRKSMDEANIFLFTSDFNEGWGAVLYEAMNSGCAVVASHAIGAVPFLLKNKENGLIYKYGNFNNFFQCVKLLLDNKQLREHLGTNAYSSIYTEWNANVAAERFLKLAEELMKNKTASLYNDGPCSKAPVLRNNWFR